MSWYWKMLAPFALLPLLCFADARDRVADDHGQRLDAFPVHARLPLPLFGARRCGMRGRDGRSDRVAATRIAADSEIVRNVAVGVVVGAALRHDGALGRVTLARDYDQHLADVAATRAPADPGARGRSRPEGRSRERAVQPRPAPDAPRSRSTSSRFRGATSTGACRARTSTIRPAWSGWSSIAGSSTRHGAAVADDLLAGEFTVRFERSTSSWRERTDPAAPRAEQPEQFRCEARRPSRDRRAALDGQRSGRSRSARRPTAGTRDVGDVLGLRVATERNRVAARAPALRASRTRRPSSACRPRPGRCSWRGRRAAPYCTASEPGQRVDAALARGVARAVAVAADARPSTRSSRSSRRLRRATASACRDHRERPDQVHPQHVHEVVDRHLVRGLQVGAVEDAGRGDDADATRPSSSIARRDGVPHRGVVADVARVRRRAAIRSFDQRRRLARVARRSRSMTATTPPSRATRNAVARPMPLPPPVTSTASCITRTRNDCRVCTSVRRRRGTTWRAPAMHACRRQGRSIVTGAGKGVGKGMALHLGKGGAAIVVAEWKPELHGADLRRARRARRSRTWASSATCSERTEIERDGRRRRSTRVRPRRLPHQQRADLPAAGADRGGERARPRRLLHVGREGHALGDAGRVPAHAATRAGAASSTSHRRWASPAARGFAAYNASKEAIRALTRTAAREWAIDGIVVNAIAPAAADPPRRGRRAERGLPHLHRELPDGPPRRPRARHRRVAWFLCSDACRYLTGHTFMVDGGAFMWA